MFKRVLSVGIAALLAALLTLPVGAAQKVVIKGKKFVADTFMGVPAYYDEGENGYYGRWQCFEYVQRFYREAYDLEMYASTGCASPTMVTPGYGFQKTKKPKPGDLLYSPAERRGKPYSHWAVVKTCVNGVVTLAEQNHHWNGTVVIDRETPVSHAEYDFFTPVGVGRADPQLGEKHEQAKKTASNVPAWFRWFWDLFH
ncbi:MAG: CHAP domain-containing protein [Oscillospiraceae bacterium]|jgi:hypothetical protein|nr:CHAP domain-containing protein [Oscillospiraceae bacterium]